MSPADRLARGVIGNQIRGWRLRRHLSQAGLARAAGINQASISNYEQGKRDLPVSVLVRIAAALDVDIVEIVNDDVQRSLLGMPPATG